MRGCVPSLCRKLPKDGCLNGIYTASVDAKYAAGNFLGRLGF
jgi:hypothetical protein